MLKSYLLKQQIEYVFLKILKIITIRNKNSIIFNEKKKNSVVSSKYIYINLACFNL